MKKIYIVCPANIQTGGPEALHQLYYYLKTKKYPVYMVYFAKKNEKITIANSYKRYCTEFITIKDIIDSAENLLVLPESLSVLSLKFKKIKKYLWWLSVVFFDRRKFSIFGLARAMFRVAKSRSFSPLKSYLDGVILKGKSFSDIDYHLCASKYACEFLSEKKVGNTEYLIEPLSKVFLEKGMCNTLEGRSFDVLYNPKKGSKIMKTLLKRNNFNYLPISGYTFEQLIDLYRSKRLYIDFGNFGGPERIPKETVYNGCVILVGRKNASKNDFDVAINEKYKINPDKRIDFIEEKIGYCLNEYKHIQRDFVKFQKQIDNLERNFLNQIDKIFADYK